MAKRRKSEPPTLESVIDEGERTFSSIWKFIAAEGVLAIAFGLMLIIWPDIGLSAIVWIIGVYALVRGLVTGVGAFMTVAPSERRWLVAQAIVATGSESRYSSGRTSPRRRFCT